ncbi:hypothetical protein D3C72_1389460 [compost metagenome]
MRLAGHRQRQARQFGNGGGLAIGQCVHTAPGQQEQSFIQHGDGAAPLAAVVLKQHGQVQAAAAKLFAQVARQAFHQM